jgi:hypothetical protein
MPLLNCVLDKPFKGFRDEKTHFENWIGMKGGTEWIWWRFLLASGKRKKCGVSFDGWKNVDQLKKLNDFKLKNEIDISPEEIYQEKNTVLQVKSSNHVTFLIHMNQLRSFGKPKVSFVDNSEYLSSSIIKKPLRPAIKFRTHEFPSEIHLTPVHITHNLNPIASHLQNTSTTSTENCQTKQTSTIKCQATPVPSFAFNPSQATPVGQSKIYFQSKNDLQIVSSFLPT